MLASLSHLKTHELWRCGRRTLIPEKAKVQMKTLYTDKDSFPFFEKAKKRKGKYPE